MTVNRGLWVPIDTGDVGTTELEARLADVGLFESNDGINARPGVLRPKAANVVTGTSATGTMTYALAAETFVVTRSTGDGAYRFSSSGTTTVATTAAPVANSRIDVVWVKQNDQTKGDANNLAVFGVTQGTAAAVPAAPTIPVGALELARATITSTTTRTDAAAITQTWRHTALRGTAIQIRSDTERAEITAPRLYQRIQRSDKSGIIFEWNGTAWATPPAPKVIPGASARIGNPALLAAGNGLQPTFQAGSVVVTTDQSGYQGINFPSAFPNGILSIQVSNGDTSASGRNKIVGVAGTPFNNTLGTFFVSVVNPDGTAAAGMGIRVEYIAVGW